MFLDAGFWRWRGGRAVLWWSCGGVSPIWRTSDAGFGGGFSSFGRALILFREIGLEVEGIHESGAHGVANEVDGGVEAQFAHDPGGPGRGGRGRPRAGGRGGPGGPGGAGRGGGGGGG